jgi:hypothetical protein
MRLATGTQVPGTNEESARRYPTRRRPTREEAHTPGSDDFEAAAIAGGQTTRLVCTRLVV